MKYSLQLGSDRITSRFIYTQGISYLSGHDFKDRSFDQDKHLLQYEYVYKVNIFLTVYMYVLSK